MANDSLKSHNKSSNITASPYTAINYSKMDQLNTADDTTQLDDTNNNFRNNSIANNDYSMNNQTMDQVNNQFSIDRINQMVMQSVERVKRTVLNYGSNEDFTLDNLNTMNKHNDDNKNPRKYSMNSVQTQSSRMNDNTMSSMASMMMTPGRNEVNQSIPMRTPQNIGGMNTSLCNNNDGDNTLDYVDTSKTELPSIYFKASVNGNEMPCGYGSNLGADLERPDDSSRESINEGK